MHYNSWSLGLLLLPFEVSLLTFIQIVADRLIVNGITDIRHHHSQLRAYIIDLLTEEGLYIKSISKNVEEKLKLHSSEIRNVVPLQHDFKPDESECRDVHITTVVESCQVTKVWLLADFATNFPLYCSAFYVIIFVFCLGRHNFGLPHYLFGYLKLTSISATANLRRNV